MTSRVDVARGYLAAFATGEPEQVARWVTDDFVNEHLSALGSGCVGRDEYRRRLPGFLGTFVRARYTVLDVVVGDPAEAPDGAVVARYRFEAEYEGTRIDIPGVMWFDVRDGLVARRTDVWDALTFLRQTGQAE
jgi:hypothetical protein